MSVTETHKIRAILTKDGAIPIPLDQFNSDINNTSENANAAAESAKAAKTSENAAKESQTAAKTSETNAKTSENKTDQDLADINTAIANASNGALAAASLVVIDGKLCYVCADDWDAQTEAAR